MLSVSLSLCLSVSLSLCLSVSLSLCLSVSPDLFVCLFLYSCLSVCISPCLHCSESLCLSVSLYLCPCVSLLSVLLNVICLFYLFLKIQLFNLSFYSFFRLSFVFSTSPFRRRQLDDAVRQRHVELLEQHQHGPAAEGPRDDRRSQQVADSLVKDYAGDL